MKYPKGSKEFNAFTDFMEMCRKYCIPPSQKDNESWANLVDDFRLCYMKKYDFSLAVGMAISFLTAVVNQGDEKSEHYWGDFSKGSLGFNILSDFWKLCNSDSIEDLRKFKQKYNDEFSKCLYAIIIDDLKWS